MSSWDADSGDPVYYADATSEEALGHAHVESCRAIVIMINDNQAIERVISTIARMKVEAPVFVRTQPSKGSEQLSKNMPVNVVASEVEGGLEILSLVLRQLKIPRNLIVREIDQAREETMHSDREHSSSPSSIGSSCGTERFKGREIISHRRKPCHWRITPTSRSCRDLWSFYFSYSQRRIITGASPCRYFFCCGRFGLLHWK